MKTKSLATAIFLVVVHAAEAQIVQRWVTRYNGPANAGDLGTAVAVDASNNVAVTGDSQNGSNYDYYTAKYNAADGSLIWGVRYNGPANNQDYARSIAMDGSGNVIVTGNSSNGTNDDYYTAKYASATGALVWEVRYNGPGNSVDRANSMVVDSSGNVIVTGESANASGNSDYYTVKYAAGGGVVWSVRYNGPGNDSDGGTGVVVDSAGDVIVTGYSTNASLNTDYYTAKYAAASGALVWERRYNGPTNEYDNATSIAVDSSGNVAVTGEEKTGSGNSDFYTAKYASASGAILWERRFAGAAAGNDHPNSVAMDSAGNVVVGGSSSGGTTTDIYTAKYASAGGALLWEVLYNGTTGTADTLSSVAVDSGGNVFIAGHSTQSHGGNNTDYYTAKYNAADGSLLWEKLYNGPGNGSDSMTSNGMLTSRHLGLTTDGGAVVTGGSVGSNTDFATLRYGPNPPAVAASAATGITATAATLNGTVNPNGLTTTAQFQYGLTTSYGTNVGLTLAPNDGTSAQNVSASLTGLAPGTLYYFRLTATSLAGTSNSDSTFTTLSAPEIVVEQPAGTNIADGGTKGFGSVNVGSTSDLVFTVKNTGTADLTLSGTPKVAVSGTDAGMFTVTAQPTSPVTGPSGSTTFTVRFAPASAGAKAAALSIANNDGDENPFDINLTGTGYIPPPTVTTSAATSITATTATLNGTVNPNGFATTAQFRFGPTAGYGSAASVTLSPNDGITAQNVSTSLTGLTPGMLYHYLLTATNSGGTSNTTDGTFRTSDPGGMAPVAGWPVTAPVPSSAADDVGTGVAVDAAGNVAVVGYVGSNSGDYYIAKYSAGGVLLWPQPVIYNNATYNGQDFAWGVACDASGNVIVTGHTYRGPQGSGGTEIDIYTAKYAAADGAVLWSRHYNNASANSDDRGYRVLVDNNGDVIVGGYSFRGSGNQDYFTAKYERDTGAVLWEANYNGPANGSDFSNAMVLDAAGNVIVTGYSANAAGNMDFLTIKYAGTNRAVLWEHRWNGPANANDYAYDVTVDGAGNVLVAGETRNAAGNDDVKLMKLSGGAGTLLWEASFGGAANGNDNANRVLVDSAGDVFISGSSTGAGTGWDYLTAKYSGTTGALLWLRTYDGPASNADLSNSLLLAPNGDVFVTGYSKAGDDDYLTIRYRGYDGAMLNTARTQGAGLGGDYPAGGRRGMALLPSGYPVVTGKSFGSGSGYDIMTVAYSGPAFGPTQVVTLPATNVTTTTATLNGTVNPNGVATTAEFQYGTSTSYGSTASITLSPNNGTNTQTVSANITGLTPGTLYHYRLTAQNGETSANGADMTFTTAMTPQQTWRQTYFGTTANTGNAADSFDYDGDGLVNLMEWALGLNPTTASTLPATTTRNGAFFEFTYTRSIAVLNAGGTFTVEWSDTLPSTSWSSAGVTEQILTDNGTVQQVRASVPVGSQGRRFVHLRVTASP